eukprot:3047691-Pyramimonas_sp.AAC.1
MDAWMPLCRSERRRFFPGAQANIKPLMVHMNVRFPYDTVGAFRAWRQLLRLATIEKPPFGYRNCSLQ